jgi:hypothetical protein
MENINDVNGCIHVHVEERGKHGKVKGNTLLETY